MYRHCLPGSAQGQDHRLCSWINGRPWGKRPTAMLLWFGLTDPNLTIFWAGEDPLGLLLGVPLRSQREMLPGPNSGANSISTTRSCKVQQGKDREKSGTQKTASKEVREHHHAWDSLLCLMLPEGMTRYGYGRPLAPQHGHVKRRGWCTESGARSYEMGTAAANDNYVRDMNTVVQVTGPSHEMKTQKKFKIQFFSFLWPFKLWFNV